MQVEGTHVKPTMQANTKEYFSFPSLFFSCAFLQYLQCIYVLGIVWKMRCWRQSFNWNLNPSNEKITIQFRVKWPLYSLNIHYTLVCVCKFLSENMRAWILICPNAWIYLHWRDRMEEYKWQVASILMTRLWLSVSFAGKILWRIACQLKTFKQISPLFLND